MGMDEELDDITVPGACWFKLYSLWLVNEATSGRDTYWMSLISNSLIHGLRWHFVR